MSTSEEQQDQRIFESEVCRIARLLWPAAEFGGAEMLDGREHDGVFETEEAIHLVEATVSRKLDKATHDIDKIEKQIAKFRRSHQTKAVKGYFVTRDDPTVEQREVARKTGGDVVAISFDQFRAQMIDVRSYIELRRRYTFGSAKNLKTESSDPLNLDDYIHLDILDDKGTLWTTTSIASSVIAGERFLIFGDFGSGKSMTMREIFEVLAKDAMRNPTNRFPILLNLRDHQGQVRPAEALRRHGEDIGFKNPSHLVRAWRAGLVTLMLDGIDELASLGWTSRARKLRDVRFSSVELVRNFVIDSPTNAGVILASREHYFDSRKEAHRALGLTLTFRTLHLNEFSDTQVAKYLTQQGWKDHIPEWLPSRPYLLGELVAKGILHGASEWLFEASASFGWDSLLDQIARREAGAGVGIDPTAVRQIIERLATFARKTQTGRGPLSNSDLLKAFSDVCGYPADDKAFGLLQRLPGLGVYAKEDSSREFVDDDFADAARAGDVARFAQEPFTFQIDDPESWQFGLHNVGVEIVAMVAAGQKMTDNKFSAAIQHAANKCNCFTLASDLFLVLKRRRQNFTLGRVVIRDTLVYALELESNSGVSEDVVFQDCLFSELDIPHNIDNREIPQFIGCYVGICNGRQSVADLPPGKFDSLCTFDAFGELADTNAEILSSSLPLGTRVMLTVLRKLFVQRGSGRKQNALFRGLDHRGKRLVGDVLELLKKEGVVMKSTSEEIWLPIRNTRQRVSAILAAPARTKDILLDESAKLE